MRIDHAMAWGFALTQETPIYHHVSYIIIKDITCHNMSLVEVVCDVFQLQSLVQSQTQSFFVSLLG